MKKLLNNINNIKILNLYKNKIIIISNEIYNSIFFNKYYIYIFF